MRRTARELADAIDATLEGEGSLEITGVAAPERAASRDLIYADSAKHAERAATSAARCVIACEGLGLPGKTVLRTANPKVAFSKAAALLLDRRPIAAGIHPTAVVAPLARVAGSASIGPYAVIGANVAIGERSTIGSHVVIDSNVTIGSGNMIGPGAIIGTAPQDLSFSPERKTYVVIGNENVIREHCTIHRGSAEGSVTKIGDKNFLMVGAHVGHNCEIGNNVIIANNCLLGGHVSVDDGAFLGGGCVFHQHMCVGRLALTQGASGFGKDIPPFVITPRRIQRQRSRRNQSCIQTCLHERIEHRSGGRKGGDDEVRGAGARIY